MKRIHNNVYDVCQLAGSTQRIALDEDGLMDCDIEVINHDCGVYTLISTEGKSYWQRHSEDCAYHSDMLSEMTDFAKALIKS